MDVIDNKLANAKAIDWLHMSTDGGKSLPVSLIIDINAIVMHMNSDKGPIGRLLKIEDYVYEHIEKDDTPHDLDIWRFKDPILEKLFIEYRLQGIGGDRTDMLHALFAMVVPATKYDMQIGTDDSKVVDTVVGKIPIDEHQSDLYSHFGKLYHFVPKMVLHTYPTMSFYGNYMVSSYYEPFRYNNKINYKIEDTQIWNKHAGTIVVSYRFDSANDVEYFYLVNTSGTDILSMRIINGKLKVLTPDVTSTDNEYITLFEVEHNPSIANRKMVISYDTDSITIRTNINESITIDKTFDLDILELKMDDKWISDSLSSFVYYPVRVSDERVLISLVN